MAGLPQLIKLNSLTRPERFVNADVKFPLTYVIELTLNTYRMYSRKITMAMVARAIEGPLIAGVKPDSLTCIWKSQIEGKMYILADESRSYKIEPVGTGILMFLTNYVMKQYNQWKVSGIDGVLSIDHRKLMYFKVFIVLERVIAKLPLLTLCLYQSSKNKMGRYQLS